MSASVAPADDGPPATPPPHGGHRTSIWHTAKQLSRHQVLYDAIWKVYRKIKVGGLATSYDIVVDGTTTPDHRSVLLSLPGEFGLFDPRTVEKKRKKVVAITNTTGIYFNRWLAQASTHYIHDPDRDIDPDDLEAALATDIDVVSYSALLQESLQHELAAHLKNHHEKTNDSPFSKRTDAGSTVERRVRVQHGKDSQPSCVLAADSACIERKWKAPVNLRHSPLLVEEGLVAPQNLRAIEPLTIEEIIAHMDHGAPPPPVFGAPTKKRDRDDDDDDDGSAGEAKRRDDRKDGGDDQDGSSVGGGEEEDGYNLFASLWKSGKWGEVEETAKNTKVDVTFCDEGGQPKSSFTALEDVFVRLTFENPTDNDDDAYVRTAGESFGRAGIVMEVEGEPRRYLPTDSHWGFVVARIPPGASHTFLRKLCGGPGGRTAPGLDVNGVPYWTPEQPGTYYARVVGWDEKFPFEIDISP